MMKSGGKYTDEDLISILMSGSGSEVDAYERIFHRYYPMVLNFIKGMLKDSAVAEDVAQNIFMKLWINRYSLNRNQSLKNYLCVMARNEVINLVSSKTARLTSTHPQLPDRPSFEPTAEEWINYSEANAQIASSIEAMPPQRREIFKMSRYEHLSNMEIAIRMNLSMRTVEKHIELALKDLRKSMN
jgi:RNA polymerase sigma-70 factor (ECF subfamily)